MNDRGPYFVTRRDLNVDQENNWFNTTDNRTFDEYLDEEVIVGKGFGFLLKEQNKERR